MADGEFLKRIDQNAELEPYEWVVTGKAEEYDDSEKLVYVDKLKMWIEEAKDEFLELWFRRNEFGFDFDAKVLEWFEKWFGSLSEE